MFFWTRKTTLSALAIRALGEKHSDPDGVYDLIPAAELYEATGIQFQANSSVFQLMAEQAHTKELIDFSDIRFTSPKRLPAPFTSKGLRMRRWGTF